MFGGCLKTKTQSFRDSDVGNAPLQSTLIVAVAAVILIGLLNVGRLMQEQSEHRLAELLASASGNSVGATSAIPSYPSSPSSLATTRMMAYGDTSQRFDLPAAADSVEGSKPIVPAPQEPGPGGPQEPVPVNGPDPTKEPGTGTEPEPVAGGDPEPDPNDPEAEPTTSKTPKKRKAKKNSQGTGDPETVLEPEGTEGQGLPAGLGAGMNPMSMLSGGVPAFGSPSAFGPQSQGSGFNSGSGFPSNGFPSGGTGGQSAGGQYSSPIADGLLGLSGLDAQKQFSEPRQRRSQSARKSKVDTPDESDESDEPKETAEQLAGRKDRVTSGSNDEKNHAEPPHGNADELEAVQEVSLNEPLSETATDTLQILGLDRTPGKGPRVTIRCHEQFEYIEVSGGGQKLRYKAPMPGRSGNIPLISAGRTIGGIEITGVSGANRVTRTYVVPGSPLAGSDGEPIPGQQLESDDVESGDPETGDEGKTEVVDAETEL